MRHRLQQLHTTASGSSVIQEPAWRIKERNELGLRGYQVEVEGNEGPHPTVTGEKYQRLLRIHGESRSYQIAQTAMEVHESACQTSARLPSCSKFKHMQVAISRPRHEFKKVDAFHSIFESLKLQFAKAFDEWCRTWQGVSWMDELRRTARARITSGTTVSIAARCFAGHEETPRWIKDPSDLSTLIALFRSF